MSSSMGVGTHVLAALLSFALSPIAVAQQLASASATGALEGQVRSADDSLPLNGVQVLVRGSIRTDITDSLGRYRIAELPVGTRSVTFMRLGFASQQLAVEVPAAATATLDVRLVSIASRLKDVIVTATRTERSVTDIPVSATVVPQEVIEETPAQTLDDVLRTVPGVNIPVENAVVAHPTSNFISMRGLGGIRTLVLVDGVPLNDPFFGYVQWNKVPMEIVDRVEVVRGGSSSLFGTYAVGGVINVITRIPDLDEAQISVSGGTNDTRRGSIFGSKSLSARLRITGAGSYSNTDGYVRPLPAEIGPLDQPGHGEAETGRVQVDYAPSSSTSAYLRGGFYRLEQNQGSPHGTDGQRVWDFAAGATRRLNGGGSVHTSLFYQHDRAHTENTDPITARGVDEFVSNAHVTPSNDIGGSVQWSQLFGRKTTVTAGLDARFIRGEDRSVNRPAPDSSTFKEIGGGTQKSAGLFGQVELYPTTKLELLASARLDAWENSAGHLYRIPGERADFPSKSKTRLNPKLAARYTLLPSLVARAAVYSAFNAPNLDQLYRPYSASSFANVPNSQLDPETLTGGEAGLEYSRPKGNVQLNVFQSTLKNTITYAAIAFEPIYTVTPVNVGKSRSRGAEIFGDWEPLRDVHVGASYTYTESVITENPEDSTLVGKTNPDVPKHEVAVNAGYRTASRFSVFVRGRYLSQRFNDASNAFGFGSHVVFDASASVPLGERFDAFLEAENVFNRLYTAINYGYDARGTPRQIFVGVRATFTARER